jgi:four helix bundle protein
MAKTFEKLDAWKEAINLITEIYEVTKKFPRNEQNGLISQFRRAAISISNNIAEGSGKRSKPDFIRFLNIAMGSLNEVENLLIISDKLGYIKETEFKRIDKFIEKERKLIYGLISYLEKNK